MVPALEQMGGVERHLPASDPAPAKAFAERPIDGAMTVVGASIAVLLERTDWSGGIQHSTGWPRCGLASAGWESAKLQHRRDPEKVS